MTRAIVLYGWHTLAHTHTQQSKEGQHVYERTHSNCAVRRCKDDTRTRTHEIVRRTRTRRNLRTQTLPLSHMQSEQRETLLALSWWQWDQWVIDKRAAEKGNILLMSCRNPQSTLLPLISHVQWQLCEPPAMIERCGIYFSERYQLFYFMWSFLRCTSCFMLERLQSACCKYGWLCQTTHLPAGYRLCYLCAVRQEYVGRELNSLSGEMTLNEAPPYLMPSTATVSSHSSRRSLRFY